MYFGVILYKMTKNVNMFFVGIVLDVVFIIMLAKILK